MHLTTLALPFDKDSNSFDESPLQEFLEKYEALRVNEAFVEVDGEPLLALFIVAAPRIVLSRENSKPVPVEVSADAKPTYEALRAWRKNEATSQGIPAYCILTNRQLAALAEAGPRERSDLAGISGIGKKTLEKYAPDILNVIGSKSP